MFNNIQSYPSYFQSSSVDGDPIALIVAFAATSFCILTPVARPDQNGFEVSVNEVDSLDGVKSQVGGRIVPLDVASYNETLYEKWGYDGSDRYKAVEGGVQNADDEKTDTTAAAQPDPNTNADNIREQQSGSDGVDGQRNGENVASTAVDGSGTTSGETAPTEPASDAGANPDDNVPADPGVDGDGSAGDQAMNRA